MNILQSNLTSVSSQTISSSDTKNQAGQVNQSRSIGSTQVFGGIANNPAAPPPFLLSNSNHGQ